MKMEDVVSSVIVQETVNRIVSGLIDKYESNSNAHEHMERLEMAQIRLENVLEISYKWQIIDAPLLRWQKKLKCVAQECDATLHKYRQRVLKEEMEQEVRNSSFPKQIADATKSWISSICYGDINEPTRSAVRRFEWFADGANEFLRSIEFGGTPRRYMFFDPLIGHLLAGETLEYKLVKENKYHLFTIRPYNIAEGRTEGKLIFVYKDGNAPEDNFFLGMMLQLSESTNIIGITIKCLQLFTSHFKSTVQILRKELTQLPTQDFSWVPYVISSHKEHWENIHNITTQWFRPNPLCCKQHNKKINGSCNMNMLGLPDVSPEPIIEVYLERQFLQSRCNKHKAEFQGKQSYARRPLHLKLGLLLLPHGSSNDLLPAVSSSAIEVINGEQQNFSQTNITLEQLDEIMLPKAIDSFGRDDEVMSYHMLWKSRHEAALFHVGKTRTKMASTRINTRQSRKSKLSQRLDQELESRTDMICEFLNLWVTHAPAQLQRSIVDWIQKGKETQLN